MTHIINSALLSLIEQAGTTVAILIGGLESDEQSRPELFRMM